LQFSCNNFDENNYESVEKSWENPKEKRGGIGKGKRIV
jgi:hypothetical protein